MDLLRLTLSLNPLCGRTCIFKHPRNLQHTYLPCQRMTKTVMEMYVHFYLSTYSGLMLLRLSLKQTIAGQNLNQSVFSFFFSDEVSIWREGKRLCLLLTKYTLLVLRFCAFIFFFLGGGRCACQSVESRLRFSQKMKCAQSKSSSNYSVHNQLLN